MSKHLFGIVVTPHGTAANNRGATEGNLSTLQKMLWNGQVHTTVSAEAIRWAMRYGWQQQHLSTNRSWDDTARGNAWQDPTFLKEGREYLDDDVLGFMSAQAAKEDGADVEEDPEAPEANGQTHKGKAKGKGKKRPRGTVTVRRGRLEVTRALSLTPWSGDVLFNAASIGATPSASSSGLDPVPYAVEVHATRYQYGFALTPESLYEPARALDALDAIRDLHDVAGNHGRFLYDFAPDALVLRWTDDFAPRMLYAFGLGKAGALTVEMLVQRVESGDVSASELIVGGTLAATPDGQRLAALGAETFAGVKAAVGALQQRMMANLALTAG